MAVRRVHLLVPGLACNHSYLSSYRCTLNTHHSSLHRQCSQLSSGSHSFDSLAAKLPRSYAAQANKTAAELSTVFKISKEGFIVKNNETVDITAKDLMEFLVTRRNVSLDKTSIQPIAGELLALNITIKPDRKKVIDEAKDDFDKANLTKSEKTLKKPQERKIPDKVSSSQDSKDVDNKFVNTQVSIKSKDKINLTESETISEKTADKVQSNQESRNMDIEPDVGEMKEYNVNIDKVKPSESKSTSKKAPTNEVSSSNQENKEREIKPNKRNVIVDKSISDHVIVDKSISDHEVREVSESLPQDPELNFSTLVASLAPSYAAQATLAASELSSVFKINQEGYIVKNNETVEITAKDLLEFLVTKKKSSLNQASIQDIAVELAGLNIKLRPQVSKMINGAKEAYLVQSAKEKEVSSVEETLKCNLPEARTEVQSPVVPQTIATKTEQKESEESLAEIILETAKVTPNSVSLKDEQAELRSGDYATSSKSTINDEDRGVGHVTEKNKAEENTITEVSGVKGDVPKPEKTMEGHEAIKLTSQKQTPKDGMEVVNEVERRSVERGPNIGEIDKSIENNSADESAKSVASSSLAQVVDDATLNRHKFVLQSSTQATVHDKSELEEVINKNSDVKGVKPTEEKITQIADFPSKGKHEPSKTAPETNQNQASVPADPSFVNKSNPVEREVFIDSTVKQDTASSGDSFKQGKDKKENFGDGDQTGGSEFGKKVAGIGLLSTLGLALFYYSRRGAMTEKDTVQLCETDKLVYTKDEGIIDCNEELMDTNNEGIIDNHEESVITENEGSVGENAELVDNKNTGENKADDVDMKSFHHVKNFSAETKEVAEFIRTATTMSSHHSEDTDVTTNDHKNDKQESELAEDKVREAT